MARANRRGEGGRRPGGVGGWGGAERQREREREKEKDIHVKSEQQP